MHRPRSFLAESKFTAQITMPGVDSDHSKQFNGQLSLPAAKTQVRNRSIW